MKNNQPPQAAHHANHDSVAPRQHPLICTGAKTIHQVHSQPMLPDPESDTPRRFTFPPLSRCFQSGSAEEEVHKHWDHATGAWKQISKQRQQVDVNYDYSVVTTLWYGTQMDDKSFEKTCIKKGKRGTNTSLSTAHGYWASC